MSILVNASEHREPERVSKMLGDDTGVRGGVKSDYVPPKGASALKVEKIKTALAPAKQALLAAAKK